MLSTRLVPVLVVARDGRHGRTRLRRLTVRLRLTSAGLDALRRIAGYFVGGILDYAAARYGSMLATNPSASFADAISTIPEGVPPSWLVKRRRAS